MDATTDHPNTRRRVALIAALVALAGAVFGATAPAASAGTYIVNQCFDAPYQAIPGAYGHTNGTTFGFGADCVTSTANDKPGVSIYTGSGVSGGAYGAWQWDAPGGAAFKTVTGQYKLMNDAGWQGLINLAGSGGFCTQEPEVRFEWSPLTMGNNGLCNSFAIYLICGSSCGSTTFAKTAVRHLTFELVDNIPPRVGGVGGSLLDGDTARGVETLTVDASDNGSGLERMTIAANGVALDATSFGCNISFLSPCPASRKAEFAVDTEQLPPGPNVIEVCGVDLSITGGANRGCERRTIQVDNSCPTSGGQPATAIDAGLQLGGGQIRSQLRARSDKAVTVRGTLNGATAPGSTVCLYEKVDLPGDARQLVDTTKVRNDGGFALAVEPGPSRLFDIVYRYNDKIVEHAQLRLESVVRPRFKVVGDKRLKNGEKVRFRGLLPGPNADGRAIALQADAGKKWRTFKVVKANAKGKFRGLYRFVSTSRTARYVFRARVKRQGGYPYLPGSSRRRDVVVTP